MFVTKNSVIQCSRFKGTLFTTFWFFLILVAMGFRYSLGFDIASVIFGALLTVTADSFADLIFMLYCRLSGRTIGEPLEVEELRSARDKNSSSDHKKKS